MSGFRQNEDASKRDYVGILAEFIALLPSDLEHVDITGGEPTLLKENLPLLIMQVCELEENAEVLMLSNGRSFASAKYTKQFAALAKNGLRSRYRSTVQKGTA